MKIAQQVESILKHVPAARDSDKELQIIYMQKYGMNLTPAQIDKFKSMPSLETVRRLRQKLQEQGKYPASKAVEQARYDKFKAIKGGEDPEKVLEQMGYTILPFGQ